MVYACVIISAFAASCKYLRRSNFPFPFSLLLFFFFSPVKCKFSRLARDEMLQAHVERRSNAESSCFNHRTFSLGLLQNDVYEITLLEIDGLLEMRF